MLEHSICQPGRPAPHGDFQEGSPVFAPFHSAKSRRSFLTILPKSLGGISLKIVLGVRNFGYLKPFSINTLIEK